ncbi:hypothetical protein JT31_01910 [Cedecea neteri]|uniref:Uncharacterized protein n=1 Tax=Cedecea neteri TaxID=158822 RepID=A0A089PSX4_9ENTR|nr:hypothetical protein [Cedecea neteri]AIR03417.1 hypothetical protein JT31_01910 [Cedecea neteri]
MTSQPSSSRTLVEQLLGQYLLIAGEIDMFITVSKASYTLTTLSTTWVEKSLADKLKWYVNNLDKNVKEHQELIDIHNIFDRDHRPFRNVLAHSGLSFNVNEDRFEVMSADGSAESISTDELKQKVADLDSLNKKFNSAIAKSLSIYHKAANK